MLSRRAGAPLAPARGRNRVRTLAVLSPPPPGSRPPPQERAAGGRRREKQETGGGAPAPATNNSSNNGGNGSSNKARASQLLEELRALTFQRTLEREQQQRRRPRGGGGGNGAAERTAPSSSSMDGEDDDEDVVDATASVIVTEGETQLLPRLPSSRSPDVGGGDGAAAVARSAAATATTTPPSSPPQQPPLPSDAVLYFAFGANLSAATLRRRGVYEVYAHEPAFVEDPATRLAFRHRGGYATLRGGALRKPGSNSSSSNTKQQRSVSPSRVGVLGALQGASEARAPEDAGERAASAAAAIAAASAGHGAHPPHVHGVLYALSRADLGRLAGAEGGYSLKEVDVVTYGGRRERALSFVSGAMATLPADVRPTERYLSALREGAADHHLDPTWQAWLSGLETVPSAGLGPEYFESPSKHLGTAFLAACVLGVAFWVAHTHGAPPPLM
jgi:hypothetical protein